MRDSWIKYDWDLDGNEYKKHGASSQQYNGCPVYVQS